MSVRLKRVYEAPADGDGKRVLVDRLWPRGVSRERAQLDWWARELAPSDGLRRWFAHDPAKYPEFVRRYRRELVGKPELETLRRLAAEGAVTLLYAAKDERHNQARALQLILDGET